LNPLRVIAGLALAIPVWAQYAGPAILSRGEAPSAMRGVPIAFRPFVDISGIYDTGLTGVSIANAEGDLASDSAFGVELSAGVSGAHAWKRTSLGLDYRGSARHYTRKTYYDGTDHALSFGLTHQASRRLIFNIRESAGMFSRDFGLVGLQSTVPFDPAHSYIPNTDFFDNRTLYFSSQADLTYQKSARMSYTLGGDIFTAKRRSNALYGVTGGSARGDMQYRLGRRTTVGLSYNYSHFYYSRELGGSDIQSGIATYSARLTKQVEFSAYGGVFRSETKLVQTVAIDPVIAAIIGRSSGQTVHYRTDYSPTVAARLSRTFRRAIVSGGFSRGVTPGNGLFLTSVNNRADGQLSYNGSRRWSAGLGAGYSWSDVISNANGGYRSTEANATIARRLAPSVHVRATFSVRQYDSAEFSRYNRLIYRATIGMSFSPGNLPVRIW